MEYKVVYFERYSEDEVITTLEEKVTELLSQGWQTQGGVTVIRDTQNFYHVYQAMVKDNYPPVILGDNYGENKGQ
jgi:hypothetical protein